MEDTIDIHCGLVFVLEDGGKANVVVGHCGASSGGGVHGFSEVFVFSFDGFSVVESEKVGWSGWWGGSISWDEREMFYLC